MLKARKSSSLAILSKLPAALPKAFAGIEVCEEHPALKRHLISLERRFAFDSYTAALALVLSSAPKNKTLSAEGVVLVPSSKRCSRFSKGANPWDEYPEAITLACWLQQT